MIDVIQEEEMHSVCNNDWGSHFKSNNNVLSLGCIDFNIKSEEVNIDIMNVDIGYLEDKEKEILKYNNPSFHDNKIFTQSLKTNNEEEKVSMKIKEYNTPISSQRVNLYSHQGQLSMEKWQKYQNNSNDQEKSISNNENQKQEQKLNNIISGNAIIPINQTHDTTQPYYKTNTEDYVYSIQIGTLGLQEEQPMDAQPDNTFQPENIQLNSIQVSKLNFSISQIFKEENTKQEDLQQNLLGQPLLFQQISNETDDQSALNKMVQLLCEKYRPQFKNFNQIHRLTNENEQARKVVNLIRTPIIQYYQKLQANNKALFFKYEKQSKSNSVSYENKQNHCMCSLQSKFTALSSLHNHIKRVHQNTPLWCWQRKLSVKVGRPNKEIPIVECGQKQKKQRYSQKLMMLQSF